MIRTYTNADLNALIGIYHAAEKVPPWDGLFPGGCSEKYIKHEIDSVAMSPNPEFLVHVEDKNIKGFAQAHNFGHFVLGEAPHLNEIMGKYLNGYYLRNIIVHPDYWKSGTGKQLIQAVEKAARKKEYPVLVTRTPPPNMVGRGFFKRAGFEELFEDKFGARVYFVKELK